jgi:hypothetical protein
MPVICAIILSIDKNVLEYFLKNNPGKPCFVSVACISIDAIDAIVVSAAPKYLFVLTNDIIGVMENIFEAVTVTRVNVSIMNYDIIIIKYVVIT